MPVEGGQLGSNSAGITGDPVLHLMPQSRRLPGGRGRGHRAPSLLYPLPLWCQLGSEQSLWGGGLPGAPHPAPSGRAEGDGSARSAGEMNRKRGPGRGGGQRKKQTEQGLGGDLALGLRNLLQWVPGTLLHREGPALHPVLTRTLGLDVRGQAGQGHIPQSTVGRATASPLTPRSSLHSDF